MSSLPDKKAPTVIKSFPGQAVEEWRKRHHGFLPSQELEWIDSFITAIQAGLHDRCRDVEFEELKKLAVAGSHAIGQNAPSSATQRSECPYCTSNNEAIRSTYYDQTCEGCVKRMG